MEKIANTTITSNELDLFNTQDLTPRNIETYVTIEPIMKFDLPEMVEYVKRCKPSQVNLGLNSWDKVKLPEPSKEEVKELITELNMFTKVEIKDNIKSFLY
jgi:hypothetical protein